MPMSFMRAKSAASRAVAAERSACAMMRYALLPRVKTICAAAQRNDECCCARVTLRVTIYCHHFGYCYYEFII